MIFYSPEQRAAGKWLEPMKYMKTFIMVANIWKNKLLCRRPSKAEEWNNEYFQRVFCFDFLLCMYFPRCFKQVKWEILCVMFSVQRPLTSPWNLDKKYTLHITARGTSSIFLQCAGTLCLVGSSGWSMEETDASYIPPQLTLRENAKHEFYHRSIP